MKIIVIHATAGAGHKKAAEAIYNGIKAHTTHEVELADALDYTNPIFQKSYPWAYGFMVTKMPGVWKFFFWLLSIKALQPLVRVGRRCYNGLNAFRLQRYLIQEQFDVIITTQFLSAEVSSYLKRTGKIRSKIICVVTDFDVHPIWINKGTDIFTGACDFTKKKIESYGIPAECVFATGIPTDEKFNENISAGDMRRKLGINPDQFTVLLATGSFGMGPLEELIALLKNQQLLIICGHNKALYERLKSKNDSRVHVYGLVNNMHEMMTASNVMVTKPGGLSIAEALVKRLPLIFFSAIPGQEEGNIRVLKSYEVAADQGALLEIVDQVKYLSDNPELYENLRRKMTVLSKPNAVKDIINLL